MDQSLGTKRFAFSVLILSLSRHSFLENRERGEKGVMKKEESGEERRRLKIVNQVLFTPSRNNFKISV